jgi:hypothetical protein
VANTTPSVRDALRARRRPAVAVERAAPTHGPDGPDAPPLVPLLAALEHRLPPHPAWVARWSTRDASGDPVAAAWDATTDPVLLAALLRAAALLGMPEARAALWEFSGRQELSPFADPRDATARAATLRAATPAGARPTFGALLAALQRTIARAGQDAAGAALEGRQRGRRKGQGEVVPRRDRLRRGAGPATATVARVRVERPPALEAAPASPDTPTVVPDETPPAPPEEPPPRVRAPRRPRRAVVPAARRDESPPGPAAAP